MSTTFTLCIDIFKISLALLKLILSCPDLAVMRALVCPSLLKHCFLSTNVTQYVCGQHYMKKRMRERYWHNKHHLAAICGFFRFANDEGNLHNMKQFKTRWKKENWWPEQRNSLYKVNWWNPELRYSSSKLMKNDWNLITWINV